MHPVCLALCLAAFGTMFGATSRTVVASAQEAVPETSFEGAASVVAVDVLIGSPPGGIWATRRPRLPAALDPERLVIRVDGEERPLVAAEPFEDGRPVAADAWHVVLAFDLVTSARLSVRRAASLLEERAAEWTAQGLVEVVAFDPSPRQLLAPTDDPEALEATLARLALVAESADSLHARRAAFAAAAEAGRATAFGAAAAAETEAQEIQELQDTMLLYLAALDPPTSRRAVIWVADGHALDPALELAALLPGDEAVSVLEELPSIDTAAGTEGFARALAALGWIVDPVTPPPPDPMEGRASGKRLGKFRFSKRGITYEAERDPERAEAELELAKSHRAAGDLDAAAAAYRRALHHFFGDRRTAARQSVAWRGLAAVLEAQGDGDSSRRAVAAADELDERFDDGSTFEPAERPGLEAPSSSRLLARATGGLTITTAQELDRALADLSLRLRVTFQVDGRLETPRRLSVDLEGRSAETVTLYAPRWSRAAGSERLDAARRRLVATQAVDRVPR
ncbi:MAG: hypothetical protein AAGC60_28005 [Acidobacteriota bacterium]